MRPILRAALAAAALAAPAAQATCYFVIDRNENTIYRSQQPPVDMSDRGAAERDAMRARGEYLMFTETDKCAPITFLTGPGTPGTLSVDTIVAGIPAMGQGDAAATGSVVQRKPAGTSGARSTPAKR
jgi:hypothetical protein